VEQYLSLPQPVQRKAATLLQMAQIGLLPKPVPLLICSTAQVKQMDIQNGYLVASVEHNVRRFCE